MNSTIPANRIHPFFQHLPQPLKKLLHTRRAALQDGSSTLILRTIGILIGLATSILLARSLGPAGYGLYAQFFSLAGLMALAVQHGMPILLTREISLAYRENKPQNARNMLGWSLRRSLIFSTFIIATLGAFSFMLHTKGLISLSKTQIIAIALILPMIPAMAIMRNCAGALSGLYKIALGQAPSLLIVPAIFLLGLMAIPQNNGSMTALAIRTIAELTGMAIALTLTWKYIGSPVSLPTKNQIRQWDKTLIPLSLVTVAMTLNFHADIQMLGLLSGSEELGIYRIATQIAVLPMMVMHTIAALKAPRVASSENPQKLRPMLALGAAAMTGAAILFSLTFAMFGKTALHQVFGAEFAQSHTPALILSTGVITAAIFGSGTVVLNMMGMEKLTARHSLIACIANISMNAILIPLLGAKGAAYATAVSLTLWHGMGWWSVWKLKKLRCDAMPGGNTST